MNKHTEKYYHWLKNEIQKEFNRIEGHERANAHVVYDADRIDEEILEFKIKAEKSKVIKALDKATQQLLHHDYITLLKYRSDETFPRKWMERDDNIKRVIDKYPLMMPMLNFMFNETRHISPERYQEFHDLTNKITGGKMHITYPQKKNSDDQISEKRNVYSVFISTNKFYEKASNMIGASVPTIKKFVKAFCDAGVYINLGQVSRNGWLYADGYYTVLPNGKFRKFALLKDTPEFRQALRDFDPYRQQPRTNRKPVQEDTSLSDPDTRTLAKKFIEYQDAE